MFIHVTNGATATTGFVFSANEDVYLNLGDDIGFTINGDKEITSIRSGSTTLTVDATDSASNVLSAEVVTFDVSGRATVVFPSSN